MKPGLKLLALAAVLPAAGLCALESGETAAAPAAETPAQASRRSGEFSFSAGVGAKYDSNVAVLELDQSADAGDHAALFDVGAGYALPLGERATVRADYAFSHTAHEQYDEFDLGIHRGSLDASYDFRLFDAGLAYHYIEAQLDGDGFLDMTQTSPYVGRLFGDDFYLRGAYTYTEKRFAGSPARDAEADAFSGDAFVLLDGTRTYLTLGYRHSTEEAEDAQFDFIGNQFSAAITHKLRIADREVALRSGVQYEHRDYDRPTPAIGTQREDERYRFDAGIEIPLGGWLKATAKYEYADNQSNLPSVDFAEHVFLLRCDLEI